MNKIKLLYDVARVMRDKDNLSGKVKISGMKNGVEAFRFDNEFSKDLLDGTSKARITSVVDYNGKQIKHESNTEFNIYQDSGDEKQCHKRTLPFHRHHACKHRLGAKEKLDRLTAFLAALNDMKVVEQQDQSLLLSLDLQDIPEELRPGSRHLHRHHYLHGFLPGSCSMEEGILQCRINKKYEVEDILIDIKGKLKQDDQIHDLTLNTVINFTL